VLELEVGIRAKIEGRRAWKKGCEIGLVRRNRRAGRRSLEIELSSGSKQCEGRLIICIGEGANPFESPLPWICDFGYPFFSATLAYSSETELVVFWPTFVFAFAISVPKLGGVCALSISLAPLPSTNNCYLISKSPGDCIYP